jgi:hypothetical protein
VKHPCPGTGRLVIAARQAAVSRASAVFGIGAAPVTDGQSANDKPAPRMKLLRVIGKTAPLDSKSFLVLFFKKELPFLRLQSA